MAALRSSHDYAVISSVVLSSHHLLFGGQVYHSLLLPDVFKLSSQCAELTARVVAATTAALYWLHRCLQSTLVSRPLRFTQSLARGAVPPDTPPPALHALRPGAGLCPEVCTVYWALPTTPLPMVLLQAALHLDHLSLEDCPWASGLV